MARQCSDSRPKVNRSVSTSSEVILLKSSWNVNSKVGFCLIFKAFLNFNCICLILEPLTLVSWISCDISLGFKARVDYLICSVAAYVTYAP